MHLTECVNEPPSRRSFMAGLLAGLLLVPAVPEAQTPPRPRRVGLMLATTATAAGHLVKAFVEAMRELGHADGQGVVFEYRWAEGKPERFPELAADLVGRKVNVIVATTQAAALAAKGATATIPIVMVNTTDPVEVGLVASLAQPGGNVTGLTQQLTPEIRAKQLQLLKETLPKVARVAVLRSTMPTVGLREYEVAGHALDIRVQIVEVRKPEDLERAVAAIAGEGIDAIVVPADPPLFTQRRRLVELARERRLPGIYSQREYTEAGGLMSYSARLADQFRRAATYVDRILRGANPASLPIESPSDYELIVNLRTTKALGLKIPHALVIRANEVIQ